MPTVSLFLCPPKPPIWSGMSQTTCWNSCLAKVSKVAMNILPVGDQLTFQHLASLERPARQKANLTKTMQKSIKDFWSLLGRYHGYLWTSLNWKKVFMMRSPLLHQSCNKYLPLSFIPVTPCFPITPFHVSVSVPTCALKSPIRTVDSVGDTRRRASFTSSIKAWYSFVALGAYICNRHNDRSNTLSFNTQTRDPNKIQSEKRGLVRISTPAWADVLGSAPE